jgi:hypothetical protein
MWRPTPQVHDASMSNSSTIAIRVAQDERDDRVVRKLADLDSSRPPQGPVVVALVDGRPVAAASLVDGGVVADPFVPTAEVVELLQARVAASMQAAARPRKRRFPVLPRLRPAA